jgi:hypothetical protein
MVWVTKFALKLKDPMGGIRRKVMARKAQERKMGTKAGKMGEVKKEIIVRNLGEARIV